MTDAQYLFDLAARQYNETAEVIERHFENVADQIRDWMPRRMQHIVPPPPPKRSIPATYLSSLQTWALRNRALTAGIVAFVGTGAVYLLFQRRSYRQKRRARRTATGARTEVVVLAGSPTSPLTTALALDLERRGYIVYVVAYTQEDAQHVRSQSRVDILPLNLDPVYPENAHDQVSRLHEQLSRSHFPIEGEEGHRLSLAGVVLVPDAQFHVGPISDVPPETWSNSLNAKVLHTILTTQQLLPLVTDFRSRVLLLTPSIVPSLNPPNHAIQSTVAGAIQGFSASLASELRLHSLSLCHFRLGHLEIPAPHSRSLEGRHTVKGTPLRQLHDSVFDALQAKRPWRTRHIGRGSLTYDLIGSWLPANLVGWMMGLTRARSSKTQPRLIELNDSSSEGSAQWEKVDDLERGS
ncbi:DUF1776-domain-containing protein [Myriangium duriaei CBS 260.36]|uniref:DUF1776-domain-containing protein n=1 Tax=Myriangium duriaei CBS 260.36 TaxID=1168546 RepID=A0A9P4MEM7_9PEZI|nr:DUF1776-domain-containing protein [Myriangium duriaei CBS 260.36]